MGKGKLLEVFYDYNCPWCYLGTANTNRLRRERDIEFRWTLFPLHPEVPVEGLDLAELFRGRTEQLEESKGRLRDAAAATGLPLARRNRINNSRRAQELEKWAADELRSVNGQIEYLLRQAVTKKKRSQEDAK